jgi:hypothetical protein
LAIAQNLLALNPVSYKGAADDAASGASGKRSNDFNWRIREL